MLKYLHLRVRNVRFGSYLRHWRRYFLVNNYMYSKTWHHNVKRTPWCHEQVMHNLTGVIWNFLAAVNHAEIPVGYARNFQLTPSHVRHKLEYLPLLPTFLRWTFLDQIASYTDECYLEHNIAHKRHHRQMNNLTQCSTDICHGDGSLM